MSAIHHRQRHASSFHTFRCHRTPHVTYSLIQWQSCIVVMSLSCQRVMQQVMTMIGVYRWWRWRWMHGLNWMNSCVVGCCKRITIFCKSCETRLKARFASRVAAEHSMIDNTSRWVFFPYTDKHIIDWNIIRDDESKMWFFLLTILIACIRHNGWIEWIIWVSCCNGRKKLYEWVSMLLIENRIEVCDLFFQLFLGFSLINDIVNVLSKQSGIWHRIAITDIN